MGINSSVLRLFSKKIDMKGRTVKLQINSSSNNSDKDKKAIPDSESQVSLFFCCAPARQLSYTDILMLSFGKPYLSAFFIFRAAIGSFFTQHKLF